jgi:hypothetical protein
MVSVNPGGEPERDDTGLPPVDIEIPDDARELDRDVQAYYRELRAQRRRQRGRRLGWPLLAKDGIVLPLLACCLILALITGTLLTVFSATSDRNAPTLPTRTPNTGTGSAARGHGSDSAGSGGTGSASPSSKASRPAPAGSSSTGSSANGTSLRGRIAGGAGTARASAGPDSVQSLGPLPNMPLTIGVLAPIPLAAISGSVLVLIPLHCHCTTTLRWLANLAASQHAPTYLIATSATQTEVAGLYEKLSAQLQGEVSIA